MTDLIKENLSDEQILEAINTWKPLPDALFYCDIKPEIALSRSEKRNDDTDEFDELQSLQEYYNLYNKAVEFVEKHNITKVIKLDTSKSIEDILIEIEKNLKFLKKDSDIYV